MANLIHNLPIPDLDDKTFEELVDEARAKIPLYAPKWTDHNLSDPGITLLELFAWLAEMQIYSLNQLPDRNYLKFLKLLGEKPNPAAPAKIDVTFTASKNVLVPKGVQVVARESGTNELLVFETDTALEVLPVELEKIVNFVDLKYTDITDANTRVGVFYHAFGEEAQAGSSLYLGFMGFDNFLEKNITITVYLYESDLPLRGQHGKELPQVFPSAELAWEYWQGTQWVSLALLRVSYLKDPTSLTVKLRDAQDPLSQYIRTQFSLDTQKLLDEYDGANPPSEALQKALVDELNRLIQGESLYDEQLFAHVTLTEETRKLIAQNPSGAALIQLNRILLEEAYPQEIAKYLQDDTNLLTQNGRISFNIPSDIVPRMLPSFLEDEYNLFWIRFRVVKSEYEIPPRIDTIRLNTVSATQGQTVEDELLSRNDETFKTISFDKTISSGLPYQVFQAQNYPIIAGTQIVTVKEPNGTSNVWEERDDFDASSPEDNHYLLQPTEGEIVFGDGVNGRIPPKGSEIRLTYRFGGGEIGNIPADSIWKPIQIDSKTIDVENERPASGGTEAESVEEAQSRVRKELKTPYRAVTAEDYASIAKSTPGLRVARAYAVASPEENLVTVTVMPYSTLERPTPSQGFLDAICQHLDKHRLITTNLRVVPPGYVQVSVDAEVRIKPQYKPAAMQENIGTALTNFLNPLSGGPDGSGWPFGRTVYQSEIYAVIEAVDGVDCVTRLALRAAGSYQYKNGNIDILPLSLVYSGTHNITIRDSETVCKKRY